jgi:hypothetical protein
LNCLTDELLSDVVLEVPEQQLPSHLHPLTKHPEKKTNAGTWNCDKIKGADRCLSGLTGFYQSKGIPAYHCEACDFDLCEKCMRADLFIQMHPLRED